MRGGQGPTEPYGISGEIQVTGSFFRLIQAALAVFVATLPGAALAEAGKPTPGAIGLQESVTPIMDSIHTFHDGLLMWIIGAIVLLVLALLAIVIIRFNHRANPTPSKFTHNTVIEVIWTVVPILILIVIAIPSFGVLADQMTMPDGERKYLGSNIFSWGEVDVPAPELTIKATGVQWYWNYEYAAETEEQENVGFDSYLVAEEDLEEGEPRLLTVDNEMIVPVNTTVRLQVTAADVLHAFAVPSFGVKVDAVPGRLNETWFYARKEGKYHGQCSELCGVDHAFMPITVNVVSQDKFDEWLSTLRESDDVDEANTTLASL